MIRFGNLFGGTSNEVPPKDPKEVEQNDGVDELSIESKRDLLDELRNVLLKNGVPKEVLDGERLPFMSPNEDLNKAVEEYFHQKKLRDAMKTEDGMPNMPSEDEV